MIKKTNFLLKEKAKVAGEYFGNDATGRAVVFVNGFGLNRYERGIFSQLAERLQNNHLIFLSDYVDVDGQGNTTVFPFSHQAKRLAAVLDYVRGKFSDSIIKIVAHSQGCIVTGLLSPTQIDQVVLLTPPLSPSGQKMVEMFSKREGTKIDRQGLSVIKRSDGSLTYIPASFWTEAGAIDPLTLYQQLSLKTRLYFVRALEDQIIVGGDYFPIRNDPRITYLELEGNHDFDGLRREKWLAKVSEILNL